jgi:hypothetical protein
MGLFSIFGVGSARGDLLRQLPRGSVGAEIGVHEGRFSEKLIARVKPRKLYLIDPWHYESEGVLAKSLFGGEKGGSQAAMDERAGRVAAKFASEISRGQVKILRGFSDAVVDQIGLEELDWVYIDGNHAYEYVKKDLELYAARVKPGGLITGDDYKEPGWWEGGVEKAVDEFVAAGKAQLVGIWKSQFVLRKS